MSGSTLTDREVNLLVDFIERKATYAELTGIVVEAVGFDEFSVSPVELYRLFVKLSDAAGRTNPRLK